MGEDSDRVRVGIPAIGAGEADHAVGLGRQPRVGCLDRLGHPHLPARLTRQLGEQLLLPFLEAGGQGGVSVRRALLLQLHQVGGMLLDRPLRGGRIGIQKLAAVGGPGKRGHHAVVIVVRERVVLVLVTPHTSQGQPQHRPAHRHHDVVELVVADPFLGLGGDLSGEGARHEEAGGRGPLVSRLQHIPRQLHLHKLIEGEVLVQSPNDPVAVVVGSGAESVEFIAATLREPHGIQPVPAPPLAVMLALQQRIDQGVDRSGGSVIEEGGRLLGSGGQPHQVVGQTPQQFLAGGGLAGSELLLLQFGEDKPVDGGLHPGRLGHLGNRHVDQRLKRPELLSFGEVDFPFLSGRRGPVARVGSTQLNPPAEIGNHRFGQLSRGGHLEAVVTQRLQQQALFGFARNNAGTGLAPFGDRGPRVEREFASQLPLFGSIGRVARVAVLHQDRANFLFEEFEVLGFGRRENRGERPQCKTEGRNSSQQLSQRHQHTR